MTTADIDSETSEQRRVDVEDAVAWLTRQPVMAGCSIVTSLPDISEFPTLTFSQWREWFITTAELVLACTPDDGVAVFYQSDIRIDGVWIDKGHLCQLAAEKLSVALLWHRVASRVPIGNPSFGRAGYSHMLCFSRSLRPTSAAAPDILAHVGEKAWERGMGINACLHIARFIKQQTVSHTIVNPFCGHGSMLAAANAVGLSAVGVERSNKRASIAQELRLNLTDLCWVTDASIAPA